MTTRPRDPTLLGLVESVNGATVTVGLHHDTLSGLVYIEGQGHRVGQVGSFVRIPQGFASQFGIVTQAGVAAAPTGAVLTAEQARRWLSVEIVGEGTPGEPFSRGVRAFPTIGDEVHLVTEQDLAAIYGSGTSREHVDIGVLSSARSIPARVHVNRLVARHCAVVGATGSGKSTTVAGLLGRLADPSRFPSARIVVLDIHGEYGTAFREQSRVYKVNAEAGRDETSLHIPYWALTFEELLPLVFGALDDVARGRVTDWITAAKRARVDAGGLPGLDTAVVTVDTPIPFSLKRLWYDFRYEIDATYARGTEQDPANALVEDKGDAGSLTAARFKPHDGQTAVQNRSTLSIRRPLEVLASRLRDPRFRFLFAPGPWESDEAGVTVSDLSSLLDGWLGTGPSHRPLTILDLSGVPNAVLSGLVGVLLRLLYDALFWGRNFSEGGRERPLFIVMEEAHLYLVDPASAAALAVKRIVKEGRKYGIGTMIVSQRPTEIDATILSQCGTIFALRMGNGRDRGQVASATTESLKGLLDLLPTLRTGEAIIVGEAVHLPTRAMIHTPPPDRRPSSEDPRVVAEEFGPGETGPGGWDRHPEEGDYRDLVSAWRRQDPVPRRRGGSR